MRNQIRKAERSGLSIECAGPGKLTEFYSIFATRMRELGSPVHGLNFFEAVSRCIRIARAADARAQERCRRRRIDRARLQGTPSVVPWASCLKEHFPLCPNMLLYWETIRSACADGFQRFDFGRSTRDCGTYKFKSQWGARGAALVLVHRAAPAPSRAEPSVSRQRRRPSRRSVAASAARADPTGRPSPSKVPHSIMRVPLRIAFIGTGRMALNHLRAIEQVRAIDRRRRVRSRG